MAELSTTAGLGDESQIPYQTQAQIEAAGEVKEILDKGTLRTELWD